MNAMEIPKPVDRSYHLSRSIREYHDRRMLKWMPFATAELGAEWRDYQASLFQIEVDSLLENHEKQNIVHWAMIQGMELVIEVKSGYETILAMGTVKSWEDEFSILFLGLDGHYTVILIEDIVDIKPLDTV